MKTRSSLHSAVQNGNLTIVKTLLSQGLPVNSVDILDRTILHIAASKGYKEIVRLLLNHDAKVDSQDFKGHTPIHLAAEAGHLEVIKLLLKPYQIKKDQHFINVRNFSNETPLHLAALNGHVKMIKYLIDHGADVNLQTTSGGTPLHQAVAAGNSKSVKELLNHVGDINSLMQYKMILFEAAVGFYYIQGKTRIHSNTIKKMTVPKQQEYVEIIDMLVSAGINMKFEQGKMNPLHHAVTQKNELLAERFIHYGIDVNLIDSNGVSALQSAIAFGFLDMARILVKNGADVNLKTLSGIYPIHFMTNRRNYNILPVLMNAGADINSKTNIDVTIFDCLETYKLKDVLFIYSILKYGANVHATGYNGNTALHTLCPFYGCEYGAILFDWHLDFNLENAQGNTPLEYAINKKLAIKNIEFIIKFIVKKEISSNFRIGDNNKSIISKYYQDLYLQCKTELENLKKQKVWGLITFFELLDIPLEELKEYTRNSELMNVLNSGVFKPFSVYGSIIKERLRFASILKNIHDNSINYLNQLVYPIKLPQNIADEVMSYLSIYDMKTLAC